MGVSRFRIWSVLGGAAAAFVFAASFVPDLMRAGLLRWPFGADARLIDKIAAIGLVAVVICLACFFIFLWRLNSRARWK
jgi:hypothetical protein